MKNFLTICAAGLSICGFLNAQNAIDTMSVHFAAPVVVGEKTLPAGDCMIHVIRGSGDGIVLSVRSESGETAAVLVNRMNDGKEEGAGVVLGRRGNDLLLERVWLPDHTGFTVPGR